MFVDEIQIFAQAGPGGKGCIAFQRESRKPKGGPSGGNGGRGGSVILEADHDLNNLVAQFYQSRLIAERGEHGLGKGMDGHAGKDLIIKVPCGTLVWLQLLRDFFRNLRRIRSPPAVDGWERATGAAIDLPHVVADHRAGQQATLGVDGKAVHAVER